VGLAINPKISRVQGDNSMRNASYNMARRTWKKDNVERMEAQRTSTKKLGHSQKLWFIHEAYLTVHGMIESDMVYG
jgi:hypothetical protein